MRVRLRPLSTIGWELGLALAVGPGSDCSEVPVFRVQPATLD